MLYISLDTKFNNELFKRICCIVVLWVHRSALSSIHRDQLPKNFQRARPKESDYGRDSNTNRMRMLLVALEPHSPFNYRMLPEALRRGGEIQLMYHASAPLATSWTPISLRNRSVYTQLPASSRPLWCVLYIPNALRVAAAAPAEAIHRAHYPKTLQRQHRAWAHIINSPHDVMTHMVVIRAKILLLMGDLWYLQISVSKFCGASRKKKEAHEKVTRIEFRIHQRTTNSTEAQQENHTIL